MKKLYHRFLSRAAVLTVFVFTLFSHHAFASEDTTANRGYIVQVGDFPPDISIEYLDGKKVKLSELKGQVVLLQFTASWCSVCREEMPHLEKDIWRQYKNKGLVFAGIDLKEPREKVEKFAKTMKITYPLTLDEDGKKFYSFAAEGAGVTRNILIDRNGRIVYLTRLYDKAEFDGLKKKIAEQFTTP